MIYIFSVCLQTIYILIFHMAEYKSTFFGTIQIYSNLHTTRRSWFMSLILATQEAGMRRIEIQGQSRQIVHQTLSQKHTQHKTGLAEWLKW
jgi:hypothetical protein